MNLESNNREREREIDDIKERVYLKDICEACRCQEKLYSDTYHLKQNDLIKIHK
jgi:hypothetical protein